jgi:hypothetical protein
MIDGRKRNVRASMRHLIRDTDVPYFREWNKDSFALYIENWKNRQLEEKPY